MKFTIILNRTFFYGYRFLIGEIIFKNLLTNPGKSIDLIPPSIQSYWLTHFEILNNVYSFLNGVKKMSLPECRLRY
jgi:hypothetical protein